MAVKRTITITSDPKIELALRELERMIAVAGAATATVESTTETIVITAANHSMGDEAAVYVNTASGNKTVYLTPVPVTGRKYKVGNRGANSVTVNGMGRNINGDSTLVLSFVNSTAQLQYSGTEWIII